MKSVLKFILFALAAVWIGFGLFGSLAFSFALIDGTPVGILWHAPVTMVLGFMALAWARSIGVARG